MSTLWPAASVIFTNCRAVSRSIPSENVNDSDSCGSKNDRLSGVATTNGRVVSPLIAPTLNGSSCGGTGTSNVWMVAPVVGLVM